jgi:hypothetical protein
LRKLTKGTFSEQYKFKRLLQTHPEVLKRYKQRDIAINCIPAVKDIAIYEGPESCEYIPGQEVDPKATVQQTRLLQGTAEWPRRIIFPEQARQLYEDGRPMWSINVTVNSAMDYATHNNVKSYIVRIKRVDAPVIASQKKGVNIWTQFDPVPPDEIRHIENNDKVFFYLIDAAKRPDDQDPWDIWSAGLVPNLMAEFNASFYDRDVAHLYAESLRAEVRRIEEMHFK